MKKSLIIIMVTLFYSYVNYAQSGIQSNLRIDPPFWWEAMEYNKIELIVYGENIGELTPQIGDEQVKIINSTSPENLNYLFVEVEIDQSAQKGFSVEFLNERGKVTRSYWYELKPRRKGSKDRIGFSSADIVYLIMPDRFANGNPSNDSHPEMLEKPNRDLSLGRHGGDLKGIIDNLDYIHNLGYTSLWLNPVLENNMPQSSYHGYAITDLYKVDSRFGTNEDYLELGKLCHEKGMKLIKDMVFNHIGTNNYLVKDAPMSDWVHSQDEFNRSNYRGMVNSDPYSSEIDSRQMNNGWFDDTMADLNQKNPHVYKYLLQNSIWWIEYADLDGIRMDTYPYPDKDAMAEWSKIINELYPNFSVVAESWLELPVHTAYWQKGTTSFDGYKSYTKSVTDFPLHFALNKALNEEEGWSNGLSKIYYILSQDGLYANANNLLVFPDNHDTERITRIVDGNIGLFKNAITFYLTTRGIPQIYYGTEIMMDSKPNKDHGSLRRDYPGGWPGDSINAFTGVGLTREQLEAGDFMKKLMNWRKEKPVVHSGEFKHFIPENETYVYSRYTNSEAILVIINKNKEDLEFDLSRYKECLETYTSAIDIISGKKYKSLDKILLRAENPVILELIKL